MSLEDQPRSGRPSTSRTDENIRKIRDAIMFHRRRRIDESEALTGVSWSSCQRILTELHMKRVAAKFVPRLLSEDQRANRLDVCREMKHQPKTDADFLSKIITGDGSRCYGYDPETKQQSSQWKSTSSDTTSCCVYGSFKKQTVYCLSNTKIKNNSRVQQRVRDFSLKNEDSDFEFRALINLKIIFNFLVLKVRQESAAVAHVSIKLHARPGSSRLPVRIYERPAARA